MTAVKTDLSKYNNDWFAPTIGASKIKQVIWYLVNGLFFINPINPFSGLKVYLLKLFGAKLGKGIIIKPGVNIKFPWKLVIGNYSWIGENVWIDNLTDISIGDNVCLSQGAMLLTGNHDYSRSDFPLLVKGIVLKDGVWVGAGAIVCPGITCENHSVLTVKSVATSNLDEFGIYQGNPARLIRERVIK